MKIRTTFSLIVYFDKEEKMLDRHLIELGNLCFQEDISFSKYKHSHIKEDIAWENQSISEVHIILKDETFSFSDQIQKLIMEAKMASETNDTQAPF